MQRERCYNLQSLLTTAEKSLESDLRSFTLHTYAILRPGTGPEFT